MSATCANCGTDLSVEFSIDEDGTVNIRVDPCDNCLDASYDSGCEHGYLEGERSKEGEMNDDIDEIVGQKVGEILDARLSKT